MSVGGKKGALYWGWGLGHWSALRPPATPSMLPSPGTAALAGPEASPRVSASPLQSLHPLCPGLGDPGPWGYPGSGGTGLGRSLPRPQDVSLLEETVPMSWRPCLGPWPSWSWGLWSASPGAPGHHRGPQGVGAGPLFQEGTCEAWTPGPTWPPTSGPEPMAHSPYMCRCQSLTEQQYGDQAPSLKATAGGGEVLELEDPGGFRPGGGQHGPHS